MKVETTEILILCAAAIGLAGCANHRKHLDGFPIKGMPVTTDSFWAGAWREELTPPPGFPNAGHGPPAAIARGYWSRLYARAFYFRDPNGNVAVLVSCDLFAMSEGIWHAVLDRVNREGVYLPPESLTIAATHTHQGPGGFMTASGYNVLASPLPGFDRELFDTYVDRISRAVVQAAQQAARARLVLYRGTAEIQRNRAIVPFFQNPQPLVASIMSGSQVQCAQDDDLCARLKAVDTTLLALEANNAATGAPIGLLVFYAVHPTGMRHDAPLVSADLAGRAMAQLEPNPFAFKQPAQPSQKTWPVAGFFNGAEGDVSPDWQDQRREDVIRLGDQLAGAIRSLPGTPHTGADLTIDAARGEFANNWHYKLPNGSPKLAAHPAPGAAVFGGAEDGRAGILYQLTWHGGIRSKIPGCETKFDQGCKVAAVDYPLHEFLKIYGLPNWLNRLPLQLHLTKLASQNGFPDRLPIGWVRFGDWLSLAVLPVEMTTTMGVELRAHFPDKQVAIIGLANEYFSYTTTPEEYDKQQYEGASTLGGPQEGPALLAMLDEVRACQGGNCRQKSVKGETYHVGPYPKPDFGPNWLKPPRNMVDEDMDPFAPQRLAYSETRVPRGEWVEDGAADWQASRRKVYIWQLGASAPLEDEGAWNILTVLSDSTGKLTGKQRHEGTRTYDALWMPPEKTPRDADLYFLVQIPGKDALCSAPFRLKDMQDHVPVKAQMVNLPCPPASGTSQ